MKVIGPYVISAVPHLYREAVNGEAGDRHGAGVPGGIQTRPPEATPATGQRAPHQSDQTTRPQTTRSQASRAGNRKGGGPDASANLILSAVSALPMHGIDRLTGMPVLLHRLGEFVVPAALPACPHLLPVTEVDVWDAQPYAVTELPPAATMANHPATAALGVLRALTALHGAGQVHGGLNAGQFWQVGREVQLAGAGLPWQPGAGPDTDMHALGQALDALGARPAVLLKLEQMTARQALSALETAMPPPESEQVIQSATRPERVDTDDTSLPLSQPELTLADLGWNGPGGAEDPLSRLTRSDGTSSDGAPGHAPDDAAPAAGTTWNRRKTDRAAQVTASQTVLKGLPEEAVVIEAVVINVAADRTVIAPVSQTAAKPLPAQAPAPYRSAEDIIVIGDAPQASQAQANQAQAGQAAPDEAPGGIKTVHSQTASDAGHGPVTESGPTESGPSESGPVVRLVPAPIRIGFTDLPEADLPQTAMPQTDSPGKSPAPLLDRTPERSEAAAKREPTVLNVQMGRAVRFTPASIPVQLAKDVRNAAPSSLPAPNPAPTPAQSAVPGRGQASLTAIRSAAATSAARMQPLRIGWEEDHSWRVVKSGPEKRSARTRRFPVWVLALVMLALLAGAAFWLLGRDTAPTAACCSVNFTVSGSGQGVQVTLVKAPPGSLLQPGSVIGMAPGELKFPDTPGQYTLKFSAQDHGALTAAVSVPSGQPFNIVLK